MKKRNRERKNNLIKALKRENTHLKWLNETLRGPVKPLRIYTTDLKQNRTSFMISKRYETIYGEQMGLNIAKKEIGYQLCAFLEECELKVEDCGNTKRYYFDFWTE